MSKDLFEELREVIKKRKENLPKDSYVAKLFKEGKVKIANKFGEEAIETISAFLYQEKKELLEETADLIFHLMILLEHSDLNLNEVKKILKDRMKND